MIATLPVLTPIDPVSIVSNAQWIELVGIAAIGLGAGVMGGLVGIGGSLVMIPALTFVYGRDQSLYQAAAMIVNAVVAATATRRHLKAGAVRRDLVIGLLPGAVLLVGVGVWLSSVVEERWLAVVFGVFMLYIALQEGWSLLRRPHEDHAEPRTGRGTMFAIGGVTGIVSGLLGIGGGGVAVPMLRGLCHLPIRTAIAASSAVMLATAAVGSILKNLSYATSAAEPSRALAASLILAALLVPTGMIGAWIGASLTHRLPIKAVRLAFILLMLAGGLRMMLG
ncbi:MAG: sulfite exporter TauE/SafE family protein [Phycisphaerales bacterium]